MQKPIGQNGLNLIKSFEGLRLVAYQDNGGVWTIGYGHTGNVKKGMVINEKIAEQFLKEDCQKFANFVDNKSYCPFTLNSNQRDALISFAYNCGQGNLRKLCSNTNIKEIPNRMLQYNKAKGVILAGLVRRRKAEVELFNMRCDVKVCECKHKKEPVYTYTKECPEYAQPTVQKLIDKKALAVSNGVFNLPESIMRTMVMLDRMGILDK